MQGKGPGLLRLLSYNRPEWHWLVLGLAGSAFMGLVMPIFAYSLSSVIAVFFVTDYAYMDQEACTPGQHRLVLSLGHGSVCALAGLVRGRPACRL